MTEAIANSPFPLLAYLDGLVDEMRARIPAAMNEWDSAAIHKSRIASRRMKAALALMEPVLRKRTRKSFGKAMRDVRQRLGPLRDVDVMIKEAPNLGSGGGKGFDAASAWLSERLVEEREKVRRQTAKGKSAADVLEKLERWTPVRDEMANAGEAVHALLSESLHLQLDAFAEQAGRLSAGAEAHALRIAGKNLRYTLEMAAVAGHALPESVMETFKEMQDHLGAWHDSVVLTEFGMRQAVNAGVAHRDALLAKQILNELGEAMNLAGARLWEFGELWKEEGPKIADAIRSAFPLTQQVQITESQTDLDPSDSAPPADSEASPPTSASDA
jgi:CHAD domain-containing protein